MTITIIPTGADATVPGKLADAELHFTDGPLAGFKLVGFNIWQQRDVASRYVTFPSKAYVVNGERRSFALLRAEGSPQKARVVVDALRARILAAFDTHVQTTGGAQ
jgi:hypothetical protein